MQSQNRPSSFVQQQQRLPPPKKAKHHRRRHVPVGPAGVWFQAQHQHLQPGTKNNNSSSSNLSSNARAVANDNDDNDDGEQAAAAAAAAAQMEEESGIEFTQGLLSPSNTTATSKGGGTGVAFYSAAWIAMQCSLQFVTPSLPAYLSHSDRFVACRPHVPGRFVMIPEILAGHCDWKLQDDGDDDDGDDNNNNNNPHNQQQQQQRLLVLVHAIQSLADNLWVAELTDETGAKIQAWIQPRLVQQEQQRPKKKYIRPGMVWMLRNVTILLVTQSESSFSSSSSSSSQDADENDKEEHGGIASLSSSLSASLETNHDRMLLVGEENIEQVWTPPPQADDNNNNNNTSSSSSGITDAEYIAWMERRNALTTSVEDTELQENGLLTATAAATMYDDTDTPTYTAKDGSVDLDATDDQRWVHGDSIDHDSQGAGIVTLPGFGSNQNNEESATDSTTDIRPRSFHNNPPAHFGRQNISTRSPLESDSQTSTTRKGIASREKQNSNSSTVATNPSQSSQQSRFEEFSASNNSNQDDQLSHSALVGTRSGASKSPERVVNDELKHSPVPPNDHEACLDGPTPPAAAEVSLSQTKSPFGFERFEASQSASTPPPPPRSRLSASPKSRTISSRGDSQAKASAATTTIQKNESTPISTTGTAEKKTPLSTSLTDGSGKENKKRSSSSKKKRKTNAGGDKSPKEKSNLWVTSEANGLVDLFEEEETMDNVMLPQTVARVELAAVETTTDSSVISDLQKQESSGAGETKPSTESSTNIFPIVIQFPKSITLNCWLHGDNRILQTIAFQRHQPLWGSHLLGFYQAWKVAEEIGRVLRPGGEAIISISHRCFPTKAVQIWLQTNDLEHIFIVGSFFHYVGCFEPPKCIDTSPSPGLSDPLYIITAK